MLVYQELRHLPSCYTTLIFDEKSNENSSVLRKLHYVVFAVVDQQGSHHRYHGIRCPSLSPRSSALGRGRLVQWHLVKWVRFKDHGIRYCVSLDP